MALNYLNNKLRKVVAVGDVHGDYYRVLRILEEQQITIPGTAEWNPMSDNVDLVFMGDYVDWRGEALEGDSDEWRKGAFNVLWLLKSLKENIERIKKVRPEFSSRLYIVMGNHDDMMMESVLIFKSIEYEDILYIIDNPQMYSVIVQKYIENGKDSQFIGDIVLKFLNWFLQGGESTVAGFGTLLDWKNAMEGEMGDFLRENLLLGVVINGRLYSHSIPDKKEYWIPFEKTGKTICGVKNNLKDAYLWGRKAWGYDYTTGMRTKPFTADELNEMLSKIGIKGFVVGHTPMNRPSPVIAYDGRVVNIDLHGVIGSQPYVEIYFPEKPR